MFVTQSEFKKTLKGMVTCLLIKMQTIAVNRSSILARRSRHFFTKIETVLPHDRQYQT